MKVFITGASGFVGSAVVNNHGFIPFIIHQALEHSRSAFVGDGSNRWSAVHRLDAAELFKLALEKATRGARYNAVGDQGITIREIAGLIGSKLNLPVHSLTTEEAPPHFEWMSAFIHFDAPRHQLPDATTARLATIAHRFVRRSG